MQEVFKYLNRNDKINLNFVNKKSRTAGAINESRWFKKFADFKKNYIQQYGLEAYTVRLGMHKAASMAGLAFSQAGLGLCHALAHALGGAFHVPHGRLNAILLPAVLEWNASYALGKYAALARAAGFSASADTMAVRALKNGLIGLRRELELPQTLAQAGVDPGKLREREQQIINAALNDPCCETNPVKPEAHMLRSILSQVSGRG